MVAYTSYGGYSGHDIEWAIVIPVVVVAFACIGALFMSMDTSPEYEVEMTDGTVYQCHRFTANDDGTTKLVNINGTKEDVTVFTHLIVRSDRLEI